MLIKVFMHPVQQENLDRVAWLIGMLDQCEKPSDYYEFQQHLFKAIYSIEERRSKCRRALRRLSTGKSLPSDAPSLPEFSDPSEPGSWGLEVFVLERVLRQLRAVGDGLAWQCFRYDRRLILALARNASPGAMYGKDGLPYELGRVQEVWKTKRHFVLLHDLTNCIRIVDATEFTEDGGALLHEVKRSPSAHKRPNERRQLQRAQEAIDAVMNGGDLPGERKGARLIQVKQPYVTNLKQLGDLIRLSKIDGCKGMKLPQGRALLATSVYDLMEHWRNDFDSAMQARVSARDGAIKRAGISHSQHHIQGTSSDTAARSPIMAPWSIYPLRAQDRAEIICDTVLFETILSADALAAALESVGLRAEVLLSPGHAQLTGDMNIVRAHWQNRALTLHNDGLQPLLYELIEPEAWAAGVKEVITRPWPVAEPQLIFADERATWSRRQ